MAYIKIFPVRVTVKNFIKYITNPDKTNEQILVSSFGCSPETAAATFEITRQRGIGNMRDTNGNLAWHMIQSFKPGEVTPEKAHEIGKQFAEQYLKGKYEYIVATHIDKDHVHTHFAINATSFVDYKKFRMNKQLYHRLCQVSNRLCEENGLSTSLPTGEKGKSYKEHQEHKRGTSWKSKLRIAVDKAIWSSFTYEEFLMRMKASGYEIREGKNLAFRAKEQKHFTNVKTLGSYYSDENILLRLEKNRSRIHAPRKITREVRMFISMVQYVENDNYAGFENWARHHNLQEAARTFNYLSEHKLLNYDDFLQHVEDIDSSIIAAEQDLKDMKSTVIEKQLIKKHCDTYRICKKIVEKGNNLSGSKRHSYMKQHKSEYDLHEYELKELKRLGITKLPSSDRLSSELDSLEKQAAHKGDELKELNKQRGELSAVQTNFERMLQSVNIEIKEKEADIERSIPNSL